MTLSRLPILQPIALTFKPTLAWTPILAIAGIISFCLLTKTSSVLRLVYPAGCVVTAVWLYWRYPVLYLGFAWWLWFLTPLIRRLVDWQSGWLDPNPVMLTPYLVSLVTLLTLIQAFPKLYYRGGFPFVLAVLAVIYGWVMGINNFSWVKTFVPLLNWLTPIVFGFHLFAHWRQYPAYRQILQRVFLGGVLVMGVYGVVQYLVAPPWDGLWLSHQDTQVFGVPEPLGIRVFSTMNSTQPFACVMAAGLVLLLCDRSPLTFLAAGVGYLSFLLSLARSSWLGWIVALLLFAPALKQRLQIRLILSILIIVMLVLPLTVIDPFSEVISLRLQSLMNIGNDVSFNARTDGYSAALGLAFTEVLGQGLGGGIISETLGPNDSGILSLFFILGWVGTLPYLGGLVLLLIQLTQTPTGINDPFLAAARAIAISTFVQIGLNESMIGVFGIVLWSFLGIALAAQRYHNHQTHLQSPTVSTWLHSTPLS